MLGFQENKLTIQEVINEVNKLAKLELGVSVFYPQFQTQTFSHHSPDDLLGIKKSLRSDILKSDYTHKDRRPTGSTAPDDLNVG